jgi:hypothetical protein
LAAQEPEYPAMPDSPRSAVRTLGGTVWSLLLALLNATLILLALCLWLGWQVVAEARAVARGLEERTALLTPVTAELAGLRAEVAGLRGAMAELAESEAGEALAEIGDRLAGLDGRIAAATARLDALAAEPGLLVDRAVERAALQIRETIGVCAGAGA